MTVKTSIYEQHIAEDSFRLNYWQSKLKNIVTRSLMNSIFVILIGITFN
jgi:hypothetical protein